MENMEFLKKLKTGLPCDPTILALSVSTEDVTSLSNRMLYFHAYQNQTKRPSSDEDRESMVHTCTQH